VSAIVTSAVIDRPAADVFAYATDPTKFPEWQKGVTGGRMDSAGPVRVGDVCKTTRKIGGAERASTSRVTHVDAPRTWGVKGIDGPIRASVGVIVETLSEAQSRLTISVDFEGHGIGKVLVPLMVRREARAEMPANMAALKSRLQTVAER
jgi:uncharacterized protein YndB with AHSA1/START domain